MNTAEALGAIFDMVREANAAADAGGVRQDDTRPLLEVLRQFDEIFDVLRDDDAETIGRIVKWAEAEGREISNAVCELAKSASMADAEINRLLAEMQAERKVRNFSRSDAIRAQLNDAGIIVEITKDGSRWRRK